MAKITYAELVALIQSGALAKSKIQDYFEIDPILTRGFDLVFALRPDTVDVEGIATAAAASAHHLALEAERGAQRRRLAARARKPVSIIAEGDSWFSHPLVKTVIDVLQDDGYAIDNMATAGDTLENMVMNPQYIGELKSGAITHFLFSGGGIDVIGRLAECVNQFDIGHIDPENPADVDHYIKAAFSTQIMVEIKSLYHLLIRQVRTNSPNTVLVLHGYAHARPFAHGVYLGQRFEALGFDMLNKEYKALAWNIVAKLVDTFNDFLGSLSTTVRNVEYCNFRPVVRAVPGPPRHRTFGIDADWFDYELHPSRASAKRMAAVFKPKLPALAAAARVA